MTCANLLVKHLHVTINEHHSIMHLYILQNHSDETYTVFEHTQNFDMGSEFIMSMLSDVCFVNFLLFELVKQ